VIVFLFTSFEKWVVVVVPVFPFFWVVDACVGSGGLASCFLFYRFLMPVLSFGVPLQPPPPLPVVLFFKFPIPIPFFHYHNPTLSFKACLLPIFLFFFLLILF